MFKKFAIGEHKEFDLRWENYNLLNHTQYSGINGSMNCTAGPNNSAGDPSCIASSSFLHANGAHAPRRMQFGFRFLF